jgi:cell division protein ZapA
VYCKKFNPVVFGHIDEIGSFLMASVNVLINGKNYRMACEEGQEQHLITLAEKLDSYVGQLKGSFGEIGDQRLTVMAGIMVTDELTELQKKVEKLERQLAEVSDKNQSNNSAAAAAEEEIAGKISELAERLSILADKLAAKPAQKKQK